MFCLYYVTVYLLQSNLEIMAAKTPMILQMNSAEINANPLPEEMIVSRDEPEIIHKLHKTYHSTIHPKRKSSKRKFERVTVERRYGYVPKVTTIRSHQGYINPEAYNDTYSLASDLQNKGFITFKSKLSQIYDGMWTLVTKTERPKDTVTAEYNRDDSDIYSKQTVSKLGESGKAFIPFNWEVYHAASTEKNMNNKLYLSSNKSGLHAYTTFGSFKETYFHNDTTAQPTGSNNKIITTPQTQNKTERPKETVTAEYNRDDSDIYSKQTVSKLGESGKAFIPFNCEVYAASTEKNMNKFIFPSNKSDLHAYTTFGSFNETYLHNDTTVQPTGSSIKIITTPQTQNHTTVSGVKIYAFYTITPAIEKLYKTREKVPNYLQSKSTLPWESTVNELHFIKNYKEAIAKIYGDNARTKSTIKTPADHEIIKEEKSQTQVDEVAKKNAIDKFKVSLNKLASMKTSFNVDYDYYHPSPTKKVVQATNKAAGNLFYDVHPVLSETENKKGKKSIKNVTFPTDIDRFEVQTVEKMDDTGVAKSDATEPPWTKASTTLNGVSYITSKHINGITNAFATAFEKFEAPLLKLASMKASFLKHSYFQKYKEISALNKAEENVFKYTTEKNNTITKSTFAKESNVAHLRTPMEQKIDNIDNIKLVPPWIKTLTSTPKRPMAKYLPKVRQMSTTSIKPWQLTKVFTIPTTESSQMPPSPLIYEYKELKPDEVSKIGPEMERSEETDSKPTQQLKTEKSTQKLNQLKKVADRFQPKLEDSLATGMPGDNDPFSIFLKKLMNILATKSLKDLRELIKSFSRYVTKLLKRGMLTKLGIAAGVYIAQATTKMVVAPIKDIQRQISIIHVSLENRRVVLDDDLNAMLDEMDNTYDVGEEEAMQRVLLETRAFPNGAKTGEKIVQGFIDDVFLQPMKRIAGTSHGNVVFEIIAKVAKQHTLAVVNVARRNENINPHLITEHKRNREFFQEDTTEFVNPNYVKKDLSNAKEDKQEIQVPIRFDIDVSKDEGSSSNIVEIKIEINNKNNKRKHRNIESERNGESKRHAINLTKTRKKNSKPKERLKLESFRAKSDVTSYVKSNHFKNETKVKLYFDCQPLPVIVSKNKLNDTEVIVYCSNASNASIASNIS